MVVCDGLANGFVDNYLPLSLLTNIYLLDDAMDGSLDSRAQGYRIALCPKKSRPGTLTGIKEMKIRAAVDAQARAEQTESARGFDRFDLLVRVNFDGQNQSIMATLQPA